MIGHAGQTVATYLVVDVGAGVVKWAAQCGATPVEQAADRLADAVDLARAPDCLGRIDTLPDLIPAVAKPAGRRHRRGARSALPHGSGCRAQRSGPAPCYPGSRTGRGLGSAPTAGAPHRRLIHAIAEQFTSDAHDMRAAGLVEPVAVLAEAVEQSRAVRRYRRLGQHGDCPERGLLTHPRRRGTQRILIGAQLVDLASASLGRHLLPRWSS